MRMEAYAKISTKTKMTTTAVITTMAWLLCCCHPLALAKPGPSGLLTTGQCHWTPAGADYATKALSRAKVFDAKDEAIAADDFDVASGRKGEALVP
jgi:hypothetical protein